MADTDRQGSLEDWYKARAAESPVLTNVAAGLEKAINGCRDAGFDYLIIDTPPVIPCPDYRLLEPSIDGVMLVVAADKTPREMMDTALDLLDKPKTLGVIFNGEAHQPKRSSYYYSAGRPEPSRWPWFKRK